MKPLEYGTSNGSLSIVGVKKIRKGIDNRIRIINDRKRQMIHTVNGLFVNSWGKMQNVYVVEYEQ